MARARDAGQSTYDTPNTISGVIFRVVRQGHLEVISQNTRQACDVEILETLKKRVQCCQLLTRPMTEPLVPAQQTLPQAHATVER